MGLIMICLALTYLVYSFLGVFIHDNKKKRIIITLIVAMIGLAIYFYAENRHTIYMKEDVLYIKPKAEVKN
jgi:hypothetical protein